MNTFFKKTQFQSIFTLLGISQL